MSKKELIFLTPDLFEEYDNFVVEHKLGTLTALSAWGEILLKISPYMKNHTILLKRDNKIVGAIPLYRNHGIFVPKMYISTPLATINDPLTTEDNDIEEMLPAIESLRRDNGIIEIRTTFFNNSSIFLKNGFRKGNVYKFHKLDLNMPLEEIYRRFHKTRVQRGIRIAEKKGICVYNSTNQKDLISFYKLYNSTRKRLLLPIVPFSFFYTLWEKYRQTENLYLLIAELKGIPIGAFFLFKYKNWISTEMVGWDRRYKSYRVTYLLYWESIKLAKEMGCNNFDFGRTELYNTSLLEFKRGWGGEEREIVTYTTSQEEKNYISKEKNLLLRKILSKLPDFLYKGLSSFFYRHIYSG
ncbi:MAG: peptidoglycan bridge formation glycyltransferase FemA/FemB family protein [Chitinispirillaceae bacterium]|nr:peptidoglycan bridge formation glycyltransferase FemA/FemB family protein [Chitinispirillaceae bacterium]